MSTMPTTSTRVKVNYRDGVDEWRLFLPERIDLPEGKIYVWGLVEVTNEIFPERPATTQIVIVNGEIGPKYFEAARDLLGDRVFGALIDGEAEQLYYEEGAYTEYDNLSLGDDELAQIITKVKAVAAASHS